MTTWSRWFCLTSSKAMVRIPFRSRQVKMMSTPLSFISETWGAMPPDIPNSMEVSKNSTVMPPASAL